jgi:GGDEF domain-containing protein
MSTIRDLWCIVRGHKNRFAPRGPAACEQAARPRRCTPPSAPDQATGPDLEAPAIPEPDLALLHAGGEELLQAARALGRTPALAVMQVDDLPELELVFGRRGVDRVIEAVMSGLTRAAAGHGLVVRTASDTFALVMPGGGAGAAIAALQARFGKPCTIEIGSGRDEILVVPDVMVHPLGPQASVAQVYADLCRYLMKARKHRQAIRDGVPQRAECGSAAGSSPIDRARPAPAPQYTAPLPATIPVPLAVH